MRKNYFYMAFLALAFGISGCGDITCKEGESFCGDDTTMMLCKRGELTFSNCSSGCNFDTGKCKGSADSPDKGSSDLPEEYAPCSIPNTVAHKAACAPLGESKTATCTADYVFDCDSLLCGIYNSSSPFCTYRCIPTKEECEAAVSDEKKCTPEGDSKGISYVKCPEGYDCITECPNGAACVEWTSGTGGFFCLPADKKGNPPSVECTTGSYKCENNSSYFCDAGSWRKESCENGCNTSTGQCNGGNMSGGSECTSGSYKCEGNSSYYCDGGSWREESCENGCNTSTGKCNACPTGEYRCEGNFSSFCDAGSWRKESCENGCNTSTGQCNGGNMSGGSECTSGSYKCEGNSSYYCDGGSWDWPEYCEYGCDNKNGNCVDLCEPGGTQYCKKTCNYLGTEGYYYANGKVNTVYCSNYDCTTENDKVECRSQNGSGGIPAEIPSSCVKNVSPAICTNNNSVAYFCGNDGTYYKGKTCPNYDCVVCPNGFGDCGIACQ